MLSRHVRITEFLPRHQAKKQRVQGVEGPWSLFSEGANVSQALMDELMGLDLPEDSDALTANINSLLLMLPCILSTVVTVLPLISSASVKSCSHLHVIF